MRLDFRLSSRLAAKDWRYSCAGMHAIQQGLPGPAYPPDVPADFQDPRLDQARGSSRTSTRRPMLNLILLAYV
jgi:hypothetical protein